MLSEPQAHPLPPGPEERFDINADEEFFHRMWGYFEKFGSIYRIVPESRKELTYVLNHPDLVEHVLATNNRNYVKGLGFDRVKMLLGNGLIVSEGAFWRKQRRMLQPAFKKENIARMTEVMRRCSEELCRDWQRKAEAIGWARCVRRPCGGASRQQTRSLDRGSPA